MRWTEWREERLRAIRDTGRWRTIRDLDGPTPAGVYEGREVVSFASNDYLGLTRHPAVVTAAHDALDRWGAGSGAARLIVGARPVHRRLETALASWKRCEAALLFPTGFMTNLGVLAAVGGPDVRVCSDELNHASIVDGCRLSRSDVRVYPHADVEHLAKLLEDAGAAGLRSVVVTDLVFSMDGDVAPIEAIAALCRDHGALLVVDEAHAVLGPEPDLGGVDVLRVGTMSKTLGSLGGFVAADRAWIDLLVNRARPFIFTTALTPADTAASLAALHVLRSPDGDALLARLRDVVGRLAPGHPSPIVPIVVGPEGEAVAAAAALLDRGVLVPAIRPPTVPAGTSRLRIALSATHTDEHLDLLLAALGDLGLSP